MIKEEMHEAADKEHWADNTAKKIVEEKGNLPKYTIAAGITPSGVVHIGNFREIITVDLIAKALTHLGKKVRFIYSWDDYDVFRKVPANFPKKEMLEKYLWCPIVDVPDPFDCHSSFAEHNEKAVEDLLPKVGVFPEFLHQAKKYRACEYAEGMKTAIQNRNQIKELLDEWRKEPLADDWSPVRVFCEKCKTDKTKIIAYNDAYEITYSCECGFQESFDFRKKGIAKLQWRVDWPMRWAHEKVKFEPSGKEHSSEGGSNTTANKISKQIWGYDSPYHFMYEFISIKGAGGKMSSSKGNTIDLKEMLSVYEPSIVRYLFVRTIPSKSFEISFDGDVIAIYDSFDRLEKIYFGEEKVNEDLFEQQKRIYALSAVELPKKMPYQPPLRHITTVLQLNLFDEKKTFDYFVADAKTKQDKGRLSVRINCAKNWLQNYAPEQFLFSVQETPSEEALALSAPLKKGLKDFADSVDDSLSEDDLAKKFKEICEINKIEIKDLFNAAYILVLNRERGPKLFALLKNTGTKILSELTEKLVAKKQAEKQKIVLPGQKELIQKIDFEISKEIRKQFPALRIGVVIAEKIDNSKKSNEALSLLRLQEKKTKEVLEGKELASIENLKLWRDAYSSFGGKPKKNKPSIEALVRRVVKGEELPAINSIVDLYNYISIKYLLPVGGDDLEKTEGKIMLCIAKGNEKFVMLGSSENDPPKEGEIIYKDEKEVLCRRWNWRECDKSKLTEQTKKAVIYIESLNPKDNLEEAVEELASLMEKHLGGKTSKFVI
ncbi:MAG: lysine--tRNA ligase [archaeon]|nr:lysine--tRNA ligase [archaeon]